MSLVEQMLLFTVIMPFGITFALGLLIYRFKRKSQSVWLQALLLLAGFTGSYLALFGWPPFPAHEVSQWIFYFALGAMAIGCARFGLFLPEITKAVFVVVAITLTLRPLWGVSLTIPLGLMWIIVLSIAIYLFWFGMDWILVRFRQSSKSGQLAASLPLLILSSGTSVALMLCGSARLGQLAGMLAASVFALSLLVVLRPGTTLTRGANAILVPIMAMLLVNGAFYADLPMVTLLILLLSPLPFVFVWPMLRGLTSLRKEWLGAGSHLLFVAIALGFAIANQPAPYSPY